MRTKYYMSSNLKEIADLVDSKNGRIVYIETHSDNNDPKYLTWYEVVYEYEK